MLLVRHLTITPFGQRGWSVSAALARGQRCDEPLYWPWSIRSEVVGPHFTIAYEADATVLSVGKAVVDAVQVAVWRQADLRSVLLWMAAAAKTRAFFKRAALDALCVITLLRIPGRLQGLRLMGAEPEVALSVA